MEQTLEKENKQLKNEITEYKNKIEEYKHKFNVYTKEQASLLFKIQLVKRDLKARNLKMTGFNSFNKYKYFELKDITPHIVDILAERKIASMFFTKEDIMYLQLVDGETGAWLQWNSRIKRVPNHKYPTGDLGACMKEEQALETYARRGLWLKALDIVEAVELEQPTSKQKKQQTSKPAPEVEEVKLPEMSESNRMIFEQIQKEFKGVALFNKKTVTNKLNSMLKNGKIDINSRNECLKILGTMEL